MQLAFRRSILHPGFRGLPHLGLTAARGGTALIVAGALLAIGAGAGVAAATAAESELMVRVRATPASLQEPGGAYRVHVAVRNRSDADVTLTSLTDTAAGDLDEAGTCAIGGTIEAGDDYDCSFEASLSGDAGDSRTDAIMATVKGDAGPSRSAVSQVTVTLTDVPPSIAVTKVVDRPRVSPGTTVTFTVGVRNTSAESVTLTGLVDSIHGDLDGGGTCVTGGAIALDATYACSFTARISTDETDVVTATVTDDEHGSASGSADATVAVVGLAIDKSNDAPLVSLVLPDGSTADLPTAPEGTTVDYTLAYTLTGDPLGNAVITDVVPFGLQYVKGSATGDGAFAFTSSDASSGRLSWTATTLTTSGSVSYSAFVVEGASTLSQPIENVAAIVSDGTDPTDDFSDIFVPAAVAGETSGPRTPPPTDALGSETPAASGSAIGPFLVLLTVLVAGICVATSMPGARRRDRR
jgi:uncharacterized repeat protein (TIGR01451 family)